MIFFSILKQFYWFIFGGARSWLQCGLFSSYGERGCCLVSVCELLTVGLLSSWRQALAHVGFSSCCSPAREHRLSSCGAWASLPWGMWDQTTVSCIGRQLLYHWASREAPHNFFVNRREGEDLFSVLWFHSNEHCRRRKQQENKGWTWGQRGYFFRVPFWNGTGNYLISHMWALAPAEGSTEALCRVNTTPRDDSACPSSRRAQPEKRGWSQAFSAAQPEAEGRGPALVHFVSHCTCLGEGGLDFSIERVNPSLALFQSSYQTLGQINSPETLRSGVEGRKSEDALMEQGQTCSEGGRHQK